MIIIWKVGVERIRSRAAWHCGVWLMFSLVVHLGWMWFWPRTEPVVQTAQSASAAPLALAFAMAPPGGPTADAPKAPVPEVTPAPELLKPAPVSRPAKPVVDPEPAPVVKPPPTRPPVAVETPVTAPRADTVERREPPLAAPDRGTASGQASGAGGMAGASAADVASVVLSAPVVTQSPRYARPPERPSYPSMARRRGWQGEVWLQIDVSPSGESGEPTLLRSSGFEMLDKAALAVARQWRFIPEMRDGQPVATRVQVPVQFALR